MDPQSDEFVDAENCHISRIQISFSLDRSHRMEAAAEKDIVITIYQELHIHRLIVNICTQLEQNATADVLKVLSIDLHDKALAAIPPVAKVGPQCNIV